MRLSEYCINATAVIVRVCYEYEAGSRKQVACIKGACRQKAVTPSGRKK